MSDGGSAAGTGIYLYCLAPPESRAAVHELAAQGLAGIDERHPVSMLEDSAVVAVVGEVELADFSEQNLQTLAWLGPRALRHEAVVERVMGLSPVLPVKFGTLFANRARLNTFLEQNGDRIVRVLVELGDSAEWSVKAHLSDELARANLLANDPSLQSQAASMSTAPGRRYLQQKQFDATVNVALQAWIERITRELHGALATGAVASAELRCHARALTGRVDRMVFNCSFLVTPATLVDFQEKVAALERLHHGTGLSFELKGPWPPYNFCGAVFEKSAA